MYCTHFSLKFKNDELQIKKNRLQIKWHFQLKYSLVKKTIWVKILFDNNKVLAIQVISLLFLFNNNFFLKMPPLGL